MYGEELRTYNETRYDHIPVYSPPGGKPAVLAVEKPGRDVTDGRTVLAGSVCGRGRDGESETKIKKRLRCCTT